MKYKYYKYDYDTAIVTVKYTDGSEYRKTWDVYYDLYDSKQRQIGFKDLVFSDDFMSIKALKINFRNWLSGSGLLGHVVSIKWETI